MINIIKDFLIEFFLNTFFYIDQEISSSQNYACKKVTLKKSAVPFQNYPKIF